MRARVCVFVCVVGLGLGLDWTGAGLGWAGLGWAPILCENGMDSGMVPLTSAAVQSSPRLWFALPLFDLASPHLRRLNKSHNMEKI